MWISRYFVYFVIFSFFGWIYESIYCTIKSKRWENRGFLYGPLCPIYGAGGVGITAIVLEYGTSWTLEKLFHAYWWDYSEMP